MSGWHAKKYANKVGMMHESKGHILANPHPYIFFTPQLDMHGGLPKTYHKFTTLTASSWLYPIPGTIWVIVILEQRISSGAWIMGHGI